MIVVFTLIAAAYSCRMLAMLDICGVYVNYIRAALYLLPVSYTHLFINFQGEHYNLGTHPTFQSAVKARRAAEERLHDPAIIAHIETLTEERRKEFAMYLRNNGGTI